jgi:hypothetical protein
MFLVDNGLTVGKVQRMERQEHGGMKTALEKKGKAPEAAQRKRAHQAAFAISLKKTSGLNLLCRHRFSLKTNKLFDSSSFAQSASLGPEGDKNRGRAQQCFPHRENTCSAALCPPSE